VSFLEFRNTAGINQKKKPPFPSSDISCSLTVVRTGWSSCPGVPFELAGLATTLRHSVTPWVILGLFAGKAIGVFTSVWLLKLSGISRLPPGITFHHIAGVSLLAGIGFTMSIFIGELSFADNKDLLLLAKTGLLIASLLAGIRGFLWLRLTGTTDRYDGVKKEL
jgi:Na+/H+ antiporter NhaA